MSADDSSRVQAAGPFTSMPLHVIASDASLLPLAIKSLHSFRRKPTSEQSILPTTADAAPLTEASLISAVERVFLAACGATRFPDPVELSSLDQTMPSCEGAVIVFVSNSREVTAAFMGTVVPKLPRDVLVLIAGDDAHVTDAFVANAPSGIGAEVLFASVFGPWWSNSRALSQTSEIVLTSPSSSVIDPTNSTVRRVSGSFLKPQSVIDTVVATATRAYSVRTPFPDSRYTAGSLTLEGGRRLITGTVFGRFLQWHHFFCVISALANAPL